jgi:hypothetical protein
MARKETGNQLLSIKAMFESGSVTKMRDIEKLFPTKIARELGMNHSRYVIKLKKPELFNFKQIVKLASLINVSPERITEVILYEVSKGRKKPVKSSEGF